MGLTLQSKSCYRPNVNVCTQLKMCLNQYSFILNSHTISYILGDLSCGSDSPVKELQDNTQGHPHGCSMSHLTCYSSGCNFQVVISNTL